MDERRVNIQVDQGVPIGPLVFALGSFAFACLFWLRNHRKTASFPPGPPCIPWLGPIPLRMRPLSFDILDMCTNHIHTNLTCLSCLWKTKAVMNAENIFISLKF